jgi:hypothetical protein
MSNQVWLLQLGCPYLFQNLPLVWREVMVGLWSARMLQLLT